MSSSYIIPHKLFSCFLIVEAKEVLQGVLGARVIGFQDYSYIKHFISSCARVLGVDHTPTGIFLSNSSVFFSVLPIGVDPLRVQRFLESENVKERIKNLRDIYKEKYVLVGIDKSEQVRGVKHKLNGFKTFLQKYPEWIGKVHVQGVQFVGHPGSSHDTRHSVGQQG